jgi:hypothetical protein
MKEKLKIGLLLNNYFVQAWEYKILEELIHSNYAEIVLVVKHDSKLELDISTKTAIGSANLKLHEGVDKLLFKNEPDYYLKKNSFDLLTDISGIVISPILEGFVSRFKAEDLAEVKAYKLDIILNFGFSFLKGDIFVIPKYGIWSYRMDNKRRPDAISSGYWEVVRKYPVTSSVLEILKEDSEKGTTIYRSWESTYGYSVNVNRNKLFWRASLFMPRIIKGIYKYGDGFLSRLIDKYKLEEPANASDFYLVPSFFSSLRNFCISLIVAAKQTFKKIFYTDAFNWILLFEIKNIEDVLSNSYGNFKKLKPPKDKFWADPFVISTKSKYYIFIEEFIYKTKKGHITVIELDKEGNFLSSERIIERPYHMSYPFIFMINDSYYMIPETSQNKTIELFKCQDFPYKWEFTKKLMENLSAVDTTLFFHKNKWWLFTSIDETNNISGGSTELFLFFSDDLFSDVWESHPCNPIISDVRTARPAGRIFKQNNKIFRPSQDCSIRYGKGFNLNQITILSETEYEEKLILKVDTEWDKDLKGTHTFNFDEDITIIDAYSYRRRI